MLIDSYRPIEKKECTFVYIILSRLVIYELVTANVGKRKLPLVTIRTTLGLLVP